MNINDRIFTYPVLTSFKDDYNTSTFEANLKYGNDNINSLTISVNFDLKCNDIQKLIDTDKAEYLLHIECSTTGFRRIFKSAIPEIKCEIPLGKINGKIESLAMVVVKSDIDEYFSDDLNEDFDGATFFIPKASILAFDNLPILELDKNYEEFGQNKSIFRIYRLVVDNEIPMRVDIDSPKIRIGLSPKQYSNYVHLANNPMYQSILNSMIIFPALVYVLSDLKTEEGFEAASTRDWFKSLEIAYASRGKNLEDEIDNETKTSYELAQEIMELPVNKSLEVLPELGNEVEE